MAEQKKTNLEMVQKTSILGTDKEGNTTYKLSFYIDDVPIKSKTAGIEVYAIEVIKKEGTLVRYEMYGDIPDGRVVEYYETGEIMMEKNYFNGQKTGLYKLYYPSGNVWKEGKFAGDNIIRLKTFAENGKLISEKVYSEIVSIRTGETEVFYKLGREIARWVHGSDGMIKKYGETIDGVVKYYHDKRLKEEHMYDEGVITSIKKYTKEGKVLSEQKFGETDYYKNTK